MSKYKTKADVINGIRQQVEKKRRIPGPSENRGLQKAAMIHFSSWEAAVKAAGFNYKNIKQRPLTDIDKALLNAEYKPLKKSVETTIPAKCQKCYWRDGAICPFVICVKDREAQNA